MVLFVKMTLMVLVGIYAIRASSVLFQKQPFHPLMIVALIVFVFALYTYHNLPTRPGAWATSLVVLSLVGVAANAVLYFKPDRAHATPTNKTFSAVSIIGWAISGIYSAAVAFDVLAPQSN